MRLRASPEAVARDAAYLRRMNLERVLTAAMDRPGSFTRAELIEATGLSAPTVGSLASQLIRCGLVRDLGAGPSRGGRRPAFMEFNARYGVVAGIDLGPTHTRLAVADLRGEHIVDRIIPTPTGRGPRAQLTKIAASLRALVREADISLDRLLAVGAGAPGVVDRHRGVVTFASNLQGWTRVAMRDILERALAVPVLVDNDVNLAMLGEHWRGAARGHDNCAFIFVGTGIGAAVLIDGNLHRGHNFMAGEIGVMCMGPQYVNVDFGSHGCLETLAGLKALAARWPSGASGDPARWMSELFRAARSGSRQAQKAISETATLIGIAAANVGAVVDPSLIVLGGALFSHAEPLVEEVKKVVDRIARVPIEIAVAQLDKEAPLAGTLLLAAAEAHRHLPTRQKETRMVRRTGT